MKINIRDKFLKLEAICGSVPNAATALGYTERRYRDFRRDVVPVPKAVELAVDKLILDNLIQSQRQQRNNNV